MARFLVWSLSGDTLWLALRLQREGHDVAFHVEHPAARHIGRGLVPLTAHPDPAPGTVVVFDTTGRGGIGKALRAFGCPVLGGNPLDVPLEVNRAAAVRLAESVGLAVPVTKAFRTLDDTRAFLAQADGEWFFKVSGDCDPGATSNAAPRDLALDLGWAAPQFPDAEGFLLQQKVDGIEISTEGWFDGTAFVPGSFSGTLEDKHFLTGALGPRTGCQANVVWQWADAAPLVRLTVRRYTDVLRQAAYVGPFDVNAIVTPAGVPVFLEVSARLGFDAAQAMALLVEGNYGALLEDVTQGRLARFPMRGDVLALTQRVSTPPYPADPPAAEAMRDRPLPHLPLDDPAFFANDVLRRDDQVPGLAGFDGSVGCYGVVGMDLPAMRLRVREALAAMRIPHAQYRLDAVMRAQSAWVGLSALGLLPAASAPAQALGLGA